MKGWLSPTASKGALRPGLAAYLFEGAVVGIRQVGDEPLSLVIAYPLEPKPPQR